ncbi:MAG: deoxyribodipyrimidine photo-lyase [Gammaproteobacteria bacterium]|nr:deoxyribodipyrimidine photo-lyase [Gammaproteobacteria bacterium]
MKRHLVWFRTDLRLTHNPALQRALATGDEVVAIHIDCPGQWQQHGLGSRQLAFIQQNLQALAQALQAIDIHLHRLECASFNDIPELMLDFCQQQQIDALFANRETGINELRRDRAVRDAIEAKFSMFEADCIVSPGNLVTGNGEMYKVFTPFRNAWIKYFKEHGYKLLPAPDSDHPPTSGDDGNVDKDSPWPAGEYAAQQRLQQFCREHLLDYKELRDFPALPATSSLSPYLAAGVLSTAQCLQAIEQQLGYLPLSPGEQGFAWFNELIWREFYRHLMVAYPRLSMHQPFKLETRLIKWSQDKSQFQAWCDGQTGYPIIDAAMRCLNQTGWMHNRLRMIVASFLVKDLQIDWRWGEDYFMAQLIDADFASNNGGWQWAASTGADAAPYFRIFNPTVQGERYDKQGEFIRAWVPELASVPDADIHSPQQWLAEQELGHSYPAPIVVHKEAREKTLRMFQSTKNPEVA